MGIECYVIEKCVRKAGVPKCRNAGLCARAADHSDKRRGCHYEIFLLGVSESEPLAMRSFGIADDRKAEIANHLIVGFGRLSFGSQVVADEDRIRRIQC